MEQIFDWIFAQYDGIPTHLVVLEIIAVVFGFLSVWYSKQENILVFPTGIISTAIFVYILLVFGAFGRHADQCLLFFHEHLRLVSVDAQGR